MKIAYEIGLFNMNLGIYISIFGIIIFIFLFIHHMKNIKYIKRNKYKRIDFIGFVLSIMAISIMLVRGISSHYIQYNDLKTGNYKTIEGRISNYEKDIKNNESFSVNDVDFVLNSQYDMSKSFNANNYIEDLVDNQHLVKIYYLGENILKIEYEE